MPANPTQTLSRGFIIPIGGAEGKGRKPKILKRFVELCGGTEARILVIPTASLLNETGPLYKELLDFHYRRKSAEVVDHTWRYARGADDP